MGEEKFKATLNKGRQSWCVIFHHPVSKGPDGQKNLRVRRGLGTTDKDQAQGFVDQLNQILESPTLWNLSSREAALTKFDPKIVAAFYDSMFPQENDPWKIRDEFIPLPGGEESPDGYIRVLFVGTTGSGKTTIVRQLLGTDPDRERFPSISAAKTTICDIELLFTEGPFKSIVTFIPRDRIRQYIAECVLASIISRLEGDPEGDVIRRFLEHSEQRFRLSYILGNPTLLEKTDQDELEDDEDEKSYPIDQNELNDQEKEELLLNLKKYLTEVGRFAERSKIERDKIAKELEINLNNASREERETIQELVEDQMANNEEFHQLVDTIFDDVESRFGFLKDGQISRGRDGWPIKWTYEDFDRTKFIRLVNRFSSNYAPNFGRLLTPLVEGIRVAGPFKPEWNDGDLPKLVLMDGQGIGHTADSTSSLSTSLTSRFRIADAIVLVDNAAQPMQAGPCAVLNSLVISGHESKLILAFTHFDEVKGDNLRKTSAKKDHVLGSFDNAVHTIGKSFGREAETALHNLSLDRIVFLSNIQERIPESAKFTLNELRKLLTAFESSIIPVGPINYKPEYDIANLVLAIQKATQEFQERWKGILGMASTSEIKPEHWTRVKALTRRLGVFKIDEYDTLRPVADLIRLLQIYLSQFLSTPLRWAPSSPPENSTEKIESLDLIKKEIFTRLHELSKRRVLEDHLRSWVGAFEHRGIGSTRVRARDVANIYEDAAPIPNILPSSDANRFLDELRDLLIESVRKAGGHIKNWS